MNEERLKQANELTERIKEVRQQLVKLNSGLNFIENKGNSQEHERIMVEAFQGHQIFLISPYKKDRYFPFSIKEILRMAKQHTLSLIEDLEKEFSQL